MARRQRPATITQHPRLASTAEPPKGAKLCEIPIDSIVRSTRARRFMGDVAALAESIDEYDLLHPISVRVEDGRFILTAGERRLEAIRLLGRTTIPAFIREMDADRAYVVELLENLQRQDLSAEEEADALTELVRTRKWTLEQVAAALKRSVAFVSKRIRVFEDPVLREAIGARELAVSVAEELLAAPPDRRPALIAQALRERWDLAAAREAVKRDGMPRSSDGDDLQAERSADVPMPSPSFRSEKSSGRPANFTQTIREFHRTIIEIQPEDLTNADRGAMRALFKDLVLLARAPTRPTPRIIPPLPAMAAPARRRRPRGL